MSELSKFEITIILPTLNEGENLKILLADFIDQFMKERIESYEILIMDDGSDDETDKLCRDLKKQNRRIKFIKYYRSKHTRYRIF
jgi:dolichol-phosphate mannosyltransferase